MIKKKVMEFLYTQMGECIKEIGSQESKMVMEYFRWLIEVKKKGFGARENIQEIKRKALMRINIDYICFKAKFILMYLKRICYFFFLN